MFISLVICTYKRASSLDQLLVSVFSQSRLPDEVIVVDGSPDDETQEMIQARYDDMLRYFRVSPSDRGLTRQRNYGIGAVDIRSEAVAFLDDDTVLTPNYFQVLEETFQSNPKIMGVGGVAVNEDLWLPLPEGGKIDLRRNYVFEGYFTPEPLRNRARNLLGLQSPLGSFQMGEFSHVRASGFPLTGKCYKVDLLVGMSFAFRRLVVDREKFSLFFDGYGLYEDADYSIRALRYGENVMNTRLQLYHHHHPAGRPDPYKYGKMVIRNGYFVWRQKYPRPSASGRIKWHLTAGLLTLIRGLNVVIGPDRKQAGIEAVGRVAGWISLWFHSPLSGLSGKN